MRLALPQSLHSNLTGHYLLALRLPIASLQHTETSVLSLYVHSIKHSFMDHFKGDLPWQVQTHYCPISEVVLVRITES